MKIKATVTMIYESDVMDLDELTPEQFRDRVMFYALDDFNGGVQFDQTSIDLEES